MQTTSSTRMLTTKAASPSPAKHGWRVLERALLFVGIALLTIYGAGRLDAFLAARSAMQQIAIPSSAGDLSAVLTPNDGAVAFTSVPQREEQEGPVAVALGRAKPLAIVRIPAIHLASPLFEGTDALTLNRGLGRIPGTAKPGELGNIGIAGHRDSALRALKDIRMGDIVQLNTRRRTDTYIVEQIRIVSPEQVEVLKPRSYPSVTLITCYPFHFLGAAPQRFVVTASLAHP